MRIDPIQSGLFLVLWDKRGGGGGFEFRPRLLTPSIKAMTAKLKGQIVRPNIFSLSFAASTRGVFRRHNNVLFSNGGHPGSAILDFLNFPKPSKTSKIDKEVIKINKLTRK